MTPEDEREDSLVRRAIEIAAAARSAGNHPFGALLADADGVVLLEAQNTVVTGRDATGHAETNLVRLASARFSVEELATTILVTSTEPCAMCAGAIHWSGIGAVVYGLSEKDLARMTGDDPANPTLDLPCRTVFAAGSRHVRVTGPVLAEEAATVHEGFWEAGGRVESPSPAHGLDR